MSKAEKPKLTAARFLFTLREANGRLGDCRAFYEDVQREFGAAPDARH